MPVVLRHHEQLELSRLEFSGRLAMSELDQLAEFQRSAPTWLTYDRLSLVESSADFSGIDFPAVDAHFLRYRSIYEPMNFLILRRSAWLCLCADALEHVRYWVGDRASRKRPLSDVRLFESFESAGEWLLLRPAEIVKLQTGEGFDEIARFDAGRAPSR